MPWYLNITLLAGIAHLWRELRQGFDFGEREPDERLEVWNREIRAVARYWAEEQGLPESHFLQLLREMFTEENPDSPAPNLLRDLRRTWACMGRRNGYEFEDVYTLAVLILFWKAVRNSQTYHDEFEQYGIVDPHGWARHIWNRDSLRCELQHAAHRTYRKEHMAADLQHSTDRSMQGFNKSLLSPFSVLPARDDRGTPQDFHRDEAGRTSDFVNYDELLPYIRERLSPKDRAIFDAWWENPGVTAKELGVSKRYLDDLLLRVELSIRSYHEQNPNGGQK